MKKRMRVLGIKRNTGELRRTEITVEIENDEIISVKFESNEKLPTTRTLFWALLADENVRDLIREYQVSDRNPFKIKKRTMRCYPTQYWLEERGKEKRLIYEELALKNGKAYPAYPFKYKEGLKIEIGDLVELSDFLNLTDNMEIQTLRKRAVVSYINCDEDEEGFHLNPSKILL